MLMNDNLAAGIDTRTTRIRRTNADFFLDIYCKSIQIPLLQLEEGCPKGGVVGERRSPLYSY